MTFDMYFICQHVGPPLSAPLLILSWEFIPLSRHVYI